MEVIVKDKMKIKVGISSCLIGVEARFDGGHEPSRMCSQSLARYFDFVPECPEVGIGMGILMKPIRLIGDVNSPLIVPIKLLKPPFDNYPHVYIAKQAYLESHPDDLSSRNAI